MFSDLKSALWRFLFCGLALCTAGPVFAGESINLPDGRRLFLEKRQVVLHAADGQLLSELPLRAKALDWRSAGVDVLAVVFDADTQRPVLLRVTAAGLSVERKLAPVDFALESQCLYRDAGQLDHLFLIAKDGLAEQWLLSGPAPRLLRRLALPPGTERCRADDARHLLYVEEAGRGIWAYGADGEGVPARRFVGLRWPVAGQPLAMALPVVTALAQTDSVARSGDAADDPAIWVHPADPARSRVVATNKKQGLLSYDLAGRQRQLLEVGRLNNVDVRQGLRIGDRRIDLAVATQRDERALALFEIDGEGELRDAGRILTGLDDVYGTCLYRPAGGGLEIFVNDKDGRFEHFRVVDRQGGWAGELLRTFRVATQPEGCVVDDRAGRLFFGEEKRGIWTMPAESGASAKPRLILPTGRLLVADVEGLALYHGARQSYLIASSQGNSSYVVLDAAPPYKVRGAFRIGIDAERGIDGVSDTDGLEASAVDFGGAYAAGLLVVQDGYKRLPDGAQNFKYVAWRDIARALRLEEAR